MQLVQTRTIVDFLAETSRFLALPRKRACPDNGKGIYSYHLLFFDSLFRPLRAIGAW